MRPIQLPQENAEEQGYVIDEEKGTEWRQQFTDAVGSPAPLPEKPTAVQVEELASHIHEAMQHATTASMKPRKQYHPKGAPWWNADCAEVVSELRQVPLGTDTPLVSKTHHFRSRFSPPPQHRKLEF
jgi:hypothetical protein